MKRTYLAVFEKGRESWGAWAPDVPGTGGLGDTLEEARRSLVEGIGYMLEFALEQSKPLHAAATTTVDFSEFDPDRAGTYEVEWLSIELPSAPQAEDQTQQAA